jgi:hypothetical protein
VSADVVRELWRYPVKSMQGEVLASAVLTDHGVLGDRGWATRDERRGGIRGAKKISSLMRCAARYVEEPSAPRPVPHAELTLPGGESVRTDDPSVHERLSAALDHPVTLFPLQPPEALDHYRRGAPDSDDLLEELRGMFGREADEPLPDFAAFPPELLEYESLPGTYFDAYALLLVTRQTLATLHADVRRFRPNIVVDVPEGDGYPERAWIGRRLRIGDEVELQVEMGCPRCVMITLPFADLPQDRALLRRVVREAGQDVGVYATVVRGGTIRDGDTVTVVEGTVS